MQKFYWILTRESGAHDLRNASTIILINIPLQLIQKWSFRQIYLLIRSIRRPPFEGSLVQSKTKRRNRLPLSLYSPLLKALKKVWSLLCWFEDWTLVNSCAGSSLISSIVAYQDKIKRPYEVLLIQRKNRKVNICMVYE